MLADISNASFPVIIIRLRSVYEFYIFTDDTFILLSESLAQF